MCQFAGSGAMRTIIIVVSILIIHNVFTTPILAGNRVFRSHKRIVGGTPAEKDAWPWMLGLVKNEHSGPLCGAALIHPKWAITAAHCMESDTGGVVSTNTFKIVSGIVDFTEDYQDHMHKIKRIISHPHYDSQLIDNDIALLEMTSPLHEIPPLDIYSGEVSNFTGTVLGWGNIVNSDPKDPYNPDYSAEFSDQLLQVSLPIMPQEICIESSSYLITDNMFCAGYSQGGKDACEGDSGGPFVIFDDGHWQLAGIVSWGEGCAWPGYYGFFTRVPNYHDFIAAYIYWGPYDQTDINQNGITDLKDVMFLLDYLTEKKPLIY